MDPQLNFHSDVEEGENKKLRSFAQKKFKALTRKYRVILGTTVNIKTEIKARTPHLFKAIAVVETKLKKFTSNKKGEIPHLALKEALETVERQLRKTFDKVKRPWEKGKNPINQ